MVYVSLLPVLLPLKPSHVSAAGTGEATATTATTAAPLFKHRVAGVYGEGVVPYVKLQISPAGGIYFCRFP